MEPERILEYYNTREAAIEAERDDPYRHGFELDTWKLADDALKTHSELLIMGGNRSSKSHFCARRVVQTLVENPNTIIWCLTETSANSVQFRQFSAITLFSQARLQSLIAVVLRSHRV